MFSSQVDIWVSFIILCLIIIFSPIIIFKVLLSSLGDKTICKNKKDKLIILITVLVSSISAAAICTSFSMAKDSQKFSSLIIKSYSNRIESIQKVASILDDPLPNTLPELKEKIEQFKVSWKQLNLPQK